MSDSGLVIVDKPAGLTSHDVVSRVRKLAGTRKVGHAGTLDPMATGVLVVGVNRATRLLGYLSGGSKSYTATIRLGESRNTDDAEGEVSGQTSAAHLTSAQIRQELTRFRGKIDQVPSTISAIKVAGQRAYARARAGEEVQLPARPVEIYDLTCSDVRHVGEWVDLDVVLTCSSGTYVRAIARDLGEQLEVGGHLTRLRRTAVGPFGLTSAKTLTELGEAWQLVNMGAAATKAFPVVSLSADLAQRASYGQRLELSIAEVTALLDSNGELVALYQPESAGVAKAVAVLVDPAAGR